MTILFRFALRALLAVAFALLVTPFGLCARCVRNPLRGRPDRRAETYWTLGPDAAAG